jgi:two-component system, NarL family, nitrate/nitrite response regulator NarL
MADGPSRGRELHPGTGKLSVVVVAETRLYRDGLAQMLERDPRLQIVATAGDAETGVTAISRHCPDAVLLDIGLAGSGAIVLKAITDAAPDQRVVAFGVADTEDAVIACAEAGASGFVPADAGLDDLARLLQGVMRDEVMCSPRLTGTLLRRVGALARERSAAEPEVRLTSRETQIVSLIEQGLSNKEIAERLHIGLPTVKNHVHHLLEKLGVSRRGAAVARVRALRRRETNRISGAPGIST